MRCLCNRSHWSDIRIKVQCEMIRLFTRNVSRIVSSSILFIFVGLSWLFPMLLFCSYCVLFCCVAMYIFNVRIFEMFNSVISVISHGDYWKNKLNLKDYYQNNALLTDEAYDEYLSSFPFSPYSRAGKCGRIMAGLWGQLSLIAEVYLGVWILLLRFCRMIKFPL